MVTWNRILLIAVSCVFLPISCGQKEDLSDEPCQSQIAVTGLVMGDVPVKATGTVKPDGFGVVVTQNGTLDAYWSYTRNVEAKARGSVDNATDWSFHYDGSSVTFNNLFLIRNGSTTADVYAYAPFRRNLVPADLDCFSYNISDQEDLMWAEQNATSFDFSGKGYNNRGITVDGETKSVRFDFQHLLCKLEFYFRIKNTNQITGEPPSYDGTLYRLVGLKLTPHANTLVESGSFNMRTGSFSGAVFRAADNPYEMTGTVSSPLTTIPVDGSYSDPCSVLICPRDYTNPDNSYSESEVDYTFDFKLYGYDSYLPYATYSMLKGHLQYATNPAAFGLKVGYVYNFYFTIDNYIHFDGVDVQAWQPEVEIEYGI